MKQQKVLIQARIKKSTLAKIEKIAEQIEETKSEVVRRMLEQQIAQMENFSTFSH